MTNAERELLRDLIELADQAMREANNDGGEYDRKAELAEARALLAQPKDAPPWKPEDDQTMPRRVRAAPDSGMLKEELVKELLHEAGRYEPRIDAPVLMHTGKLLRKAAYALSLRGREGINSEQTRLEQIITEAILLTTDSHVEEFLRRNCPRWALHTAAPPASPAGRKE